jgi:hypothetical protein
MESVVQERIGFSDSMIRERVSNFYFLKIYFELLQFISLCVYVCVCVCVCVFVCVSVCWIFEIGFGELFAQSGFELQSS